MGIDEPKIDEPRIWWVTTFGNYAWDIYAHDCVASLAACLPTQVKLGIGLDDAELAGAVQAMLRPGDEVLPGRGPAHSAFVEKYAARDDLADYRRMAARFCHKIFVEQHFIARARADGAEYVIWWDADAILTRPLQFNDIAPLLPTPQQGYSYLGRKDWNHSECGFMAYNLAGTVGTKIIDDMIDLYTSGKVFDLPEWHDSFVFDYVRDKNAGLNISEGVPGNNVWAQTVLGSFSEHRKGLEAKLRKRALKDEEMSGRGP